MSSIFVFSSSWFQDKKGEEVFKKKRSAEVKR